MRFIDKYDFLSNFYNCDIILTINGKLLSFRNTEAAYQAQKNYDLASKFCLLTGAEAKKYGRQIPITTENWDEYRLYAMAKVLNVKFNNPKLMARLKDVTEYIEEGNYWNDTYWGVCTNKTYNHEGKNMLGKLLMKIRDTDNDYAEVCQYIKTELL